MAVDVFEERHLTGVRPDTGRRVEDENGKRIWEIDPLGSRGCHRLLDALEIPAGHVPQDELGELGREGVSISMVTPSRTSQLSFGSPAYP